MIYMDLCKDAELKKMLMRDKGGCMILNLIMQCGLKFQLAVQKRGEPHCYHSNELHW